jgi:hypothetical protein
MGPKDDLDVVAETKAALLVYAKMARNGAVLSLQVTLSQLTNSIKFCLNRK